MMRARIAAMIGFLILSCFVLMIACSPNSPIEIDWPEIPSQITEFESPTRLQYEVIGFIPAYTAYGCVGSSIAANDDGIYVSEVATGVGEGIRAYSWEGEILWDVHADLDRIPDSYFDPQGLTCSDSKDEILVSAPHQYLIRLSSRDGNVTGYDTLDYRFQSPMLRDDNYIMECPARYLDFNGQYLAAVWPGSFAGMLSGECISVLNHGDFSGVLSIGMDSSLIESRSFIDASVALGDSTIFIASGGEDFIRELDITGNQLRGLAGPHILRRPLVESSHRGGGVYIENPVVEQLHYRSPSELWVLYGSGAFLSDSSEIWRVDLRNRYCSFIGFSRNAETFAIANDKLAIAFRPRDVDESTLDWDTEECYIQIIQIEE